MDFQTSIVTCLKKFVVFSGRAPRSEFWYFVLFTWILSIALTIFDVGVLNKDYGSALLPLSTAFNVLIFLPSLSVYVRRLHDLDLSGWWLLGAIAASLTLIFVSGIIFALIEQGNEDAAGIALIILLVINIGLFGFFIFVLCRRGSSGENRFGPDPLTGGFKGAFRAFEAQAAHAHGSPGQTPSRGPSPTAFCGNCGAKVMVSMNFCPQCGASR